MGGGCRGTTAVMEFGPLGVCLWGLLREGESGMGGLGEI